MHSLDPLDVSNHEGFTAEQIEQGGGEQGGWTCNLSDRFSATEFTYDNGQLVDLHHHSSLDLGIDGGHNVGNVSHDLNYASAVESISQGLDLHSHSFPGSDFNLSLDLYNHSHLETPTFESHLSTADFYPESLAQSLEPSTEHTGADSLAAMPRSGAAPDYAAAADHEGWAKHYDERAASWANDGSFSMAADLQKEADYHRQKAADTLNQ